MDPKHFVRGTFSQAGPGYTIRQGWDKELHEGKDRELKSSYDDEFTGSQCSRSPRTKDDAGSRSRRAFYPPGSSFKYQEFGRRRSTEDEIQRRLNLCYNQWQAQLREQLDVFQRQALAIEMFVNLATTTTTTTEVSTPQLRPLENRSGGCVSIKGNRQDADVPLVYGTNCSTFGTLKIGEYFLLQHSSGLCIQPQPWVKWYTPLVLQPDCRRDQRQLWFRAICSDKYPGYFLLQHSSGNCVRFWEGSFGSSFLAMTRCRWAQKAQFTMGKDFDPSCPTV